MQKTILFPTDFSVGSLNIVRSVLEKMNDGQKCRIILIHGYRPGNSITELLFSSPSNWKAELSNKEFESACEVLRNKFESRISAMYTEVFPGYNQSAFNNFLEGSQVSEIYLPQEHMLQLSHKRSFDIVPFIRRSGMVVNEVYVQQTMHMPGKGMVAEVFQERVALH
jgi:hypothetical protein